MGTAYEDGLKLRDEAIAWFERYGDPEQYMNYIPEEFQKGLRETYKRRAINKKKQG